MNLLSTEHPAPRRVVLREHGPLSRSPSLGPTAQGRTGRSVPVLQCPLLATLGADVPSLHGWGAVGLPGQRGCGV